MQVVKELQGLSYAALKEMVGCSVVDMLAPVKARYDELIKDKEGLFKIAKEGQEQASSIARKTLRKVYKKVGLVQL